MTIAGFNKSFYATLLGCAAAIALSGAAMADVTTPGGYVQSGSGATFTKGDYAFTLSMVPNTPQTGLHSLLVGATNGSSSTVNGVTVFTRWSSSVPAPSGVFLGDTMASWGAVEAPVTSTGQDFASLYMASTSNATTEVSFGNASGNEFIRQRTLAFLWGSVEASNQMVVNGGAATIRGTDILAAAQALGIPNGIADSKSFYVTLHAVGGSGLGYVRGFGDPVGQTMTTMQWAPLQMSAAIVTPTVSLVDQSIPPAPVAGTPPSGVPAPVVGSTPLGALLGFAALGMIGLGRRTKLAQPA